MYEIIYIQTREDSFEDGDEERQRAKGQFTTNMKVVGRFKSVVKKGEEVSESSEDTGSLSHSHPKGYYLLNHFAPEVFKL